MNIFKKIFGKSDKPTVNNVPDIDKLINSDDINSSIIELDNHISSICDYGERIERLNEQQKVFFHIQTLEREINNGGFNQFYFNSSGDFAHEIVDSLKIIGAEKTSLIMEKANNQFPDKRVPKNRNERQEILEQIEDSANEIWDNLDKQFCAYEENLNNLNIEYIKKYRDKIIDRTQPGH